MRKTRPRDNCKFMLTVPAAAVTPYYSSHFRAEEQIKREKERHERHLKRHLEREKGMLGDMRKK